MKFDIPPSTSSLRNNILRNLDYSDYEIFLNDHANVGNDAIKLTALTTARTKKALMKRY